MEAPIAQLTYWNGRGQAETIRLMLVASGEPWEEKVYLNEDSQNISSFAEFKSIQESGALAFEQVAD